MTRDLAEAVQWWRKAADQGNGDAQKHLQFRNNSSWGVAEDYVEEVKWARKAAEQGFAYAQSILGDCYYKGSGVAKDRVEAVRWWRKAAEQGFAGAQSGLGFCYATGEGAAKDEVEAYAFWNLAMITDKDEASNFAILAKRMSPDAISRGEKRTKELQKEIEVKIAAKKAEDANKAGK